MWLAAPLLAFAGAVLLHAATSRIREGSNRVRSFMWIGAGIGLVMAVAVLDRYSVSPQAVAALLVYAGACELYLFLFTMTLSSISANVLTRLLHGSLSRGDLSALYAGPEMAARRVDRLLSAGFATMRSGTIHLTERGRRLAARANVVRAAFHPTFPGTASIDPSRLVLTAIVGAALFTPLLYFAIQEISLAHTYEESVGYRYFYSLRMAYSSEYQWLPQGHLPSLTASALQHFLTLAGHPVSELFPRIDLFVAWGSILPLILATFGYWLACGEVRTALGRIAVALAFALTVVNPRYSLEWLAIPEYLAWVLPVGLFTYWLMLRTLSRTDSPTQREALFFGLFCGVCLSIKLSLAVFPLAVAGIAVTRYHRPRRFLGDAMVTAAVGTAFFLAVLLLTYHGNPKWIYRFVSEFIYFAQTQKFTLDAHKLEASAWLRDLLPASLRDIALLMFGAPLALLAVGISKHRALLGVLPASALSIAFYSLRPYTVSAVETTTLAVTVTAVAAMVATGKTGGPSNRFWWRAAAWAGCCLLGVVMLEAATQRLRMLSRDSRELMAAYDDLSAKLATRPGATAYFAVDNRYRLRSIDSGLCKGGTTVYDLKWRPDLYVAKLFPERICYYFTRQWVDTSLFNKFVMFSPDVAEPTSRAKGRIESFFSVSLSRFTCRDSVVVRAGRYHLCFKDEGAKGAASIKSAP